MTLMQHLETNSAGLTPTGPLERPESRPRGTSRGRSGDSPMARWAVWMWLMAGLCLVVVPARTVWVTAADELDGEEADANELTPAQRVQVLRNKLQSPQGARIQGRPLQQAMEQLAEDHGFKFRFDPEALKKNQLDPERAEVTINVRQRKLIGILREVLGQHGLRPVLDGETVVVMTLPPPAAGEKRRPVRDNAPLESLVEGEVVIVKDQPVERRRPDVADPEQPEMADQAAPEDDGDSPAVEPGVVPGNAAPGDGQKEQERQIRQQFEAQFAGILRSETRLVSQAVGEDAALRSGLTEAGRKQFRKIVNDRVRVQLQMMMGWNGQSPNLPETATELRKAFTRFLKEHASEEVQERYQAVIQAREERRKQATIRGLVAQLDRTLLLSTDQRTRCEQVLGENWQPGYGRYLELLQHDGNNWFPKDLTDKLAQVLTPDQHEIWKLASPNDIGIFWGFGGEQFQVFSGVMRPPEEVPEAEAKEPGEGDAESGEARSAEPDKEQADTPDPGPRSVPKGDEGGAEAAPSQDEPDTEESAAGDKRKEQAVKAEAGDPPAPQVIPMQRLRVAMPIRIGLEVNAEAAPAEGADASEQDAEPAAGPQPAAEAAAGAEAAEGQGPVNTIVIQRGVVVIGGGAATVRVQEARVQEAPAAEADEPGAEAKPGEPQGAEEEVIERNVPAVPLVKAVDAPLVMVEMGVDAGVAEEVVEVRVQQVPGGEDPAAEAGPDDDWDDLDRPRRGRPVAEAVIDESNFEAWIWQGRVNTADEGRRNLERQLAVRLADLARSCDLTEAQRRRLKLAAEVDIERFFAEYRTLRQRFLRDRLQPNGLNNFWEALQPLQMRIAGGLFNRESFFHRFAPKALDAGQLSRFRQSDLDRRSYRSQARQDLVLVAAEEALALSNDQAVQLNAAAREVLVVPETIHPQFDLYAVLLQLEKIPQERLNQILDADQRRLFSQALAQFAGLKPMLKANGVEVEGEGAAAGNSDEAGAGAPQENSDAGAGEATPPGGQATDTAPAAREKTAPPPEGESAQGETPGNAPPQTQAAQGEAPAPKRQAASPAVPQRSVPAGAGLCQTNTSGRMGGVEHAV